MEFVHIRIYRCPTLLSTTSCSFSFSFKIPVWMINLSFPQAPHYTLNTVHMNYSIYFQPVAIVDMQESPPWVLGDMCQPLFWVPLLVPQNLIAAGNLLYLLFPFLSLFKLFLLTEVCFICLWLFEDCWYNEKFIILCRQCSEFCWILADRLHVFQAELLIEVAVLETEICFPYRNEPQDIYGKFLVGRWEKRAKKPEKFRRM